MHVAISSLPISNSHSARGTGVYTKELIKALKKYEPQHSYTLFTHAKDVPIDADIVHYPYFDPFFLTLPLRKRVPTVVTVHDLIPLVFPDKFPAGIRGMIKWQIQKAALRKSGRIITVSECSKNDVRRLVGIDERKIDVVYSAATDVYQNITNSTVLNKLKKKYALPENYFMYVGDVNWNKNIPGLLKAFSSCIKDYPSFIQLVLVGKAFLDQSLIQTREIMAMISELGIAKQVIKTGYVDDEILVSLYIHAQALIQPSLYEGFGLPVLEAMSLGCPVVCSSSSSLSEIAGPSIMVDPNDYHSIADGMKRILLFTMDERNTLIQRGHTWMHTFSWQRTAKATLRSYEKVLGN